MCENSLRVASAEQEQEQTGMFLICQVRSSLPSLSALQQLKMMHYLCVCDFFFLLPSLHEERWLHVQMLEGSATSFNTSSSSHMQMVEM